MGCAPYRIIEGSKVRIRNLRHKYPEVMTRSRGVFVYGGSAFDKPTDGLFAEYLFENTREDSVGEYDLTYEGDDLYADGIDGNYAKLYGAGGDTVYINNAAFCNHFALTNPYSISMWIMTLNTDGIEIIKVSSAKLGTTVPLGLYTNTSVLDFGKNGTHVQTTALEYGVWTHIVITYDGETMTLYKDLEKTTGTKTSGSAENTYNYMWLNLNTHYYDNAACRIDQVRFYGRCITATEAAALFNEKPGMRRRVNL